VAGRAGRACKPGEVVLQTHHPEHALLKSLVEKDYRHFAMSALAERKMAWLPPFTFLTLIRAESTQATQVEDFLRQVRQTLEVHPIFDDTCLVLGPTPAPLAKRAGKFRWHLLIQTQARSTMQKLLAGAKPAISMLPLATKVKWTLDVEPHELS
jgi:primosomal protein N' (replication factor Y) (superfamily II helicase)